jgi:uncharacterized protein YraI
MRGSDRAGRSTAALARGRGARLALLTAVLVAGCSDPGIVTVQTKLQQAPATESTVLAVVPKGSAIKVSDCTNGWCRVSWNGRDGYILTKSMRVGGGTRRTAEPGQPEESEDDEDAAAPDVAQVPPSSR